MIRTPRLLFILVILGACLVLTSTLLLQSFVRPSAWRTSMATVQAIEQLFRRMQIVEDSRRVAIELVQVDSETRNAKIEMLRLRAADQKRFCKEYSFLSAGAVQSIVPVAESVGLLRQANELLDVAVNGSPATSVPARTTASAPIPSQDPDQTGVLPGTRTLVEERAKQLSADAASLIEKTERLVLESQSSEAEVLGGAVRHWLAGLSLVGGVLAIVASLAAMVRMRTPPEKVIEKRIISACRRDARSGINLCYDQVNRMLELAEQLTLRGHL